ncbi:MAG: hypothetical protein DELT_03261 [Desulfovibrio sp.]
MVQDNLYIPELFQLVPDPVGIPFHFFFSLHQAVAQDSAPELAAALENGNVMPAYRRMPRRFHACGAAAYDRNAARLVRFFHFREAFVAHCRINRTGNLALCHMGFLPAPGQAGNTFADFVVLSIFGFYRPIRIAKQLTGKAYHIRQALSDNLVTKFGSTKRMADDNRNIHHFFNGLGRIRRPALGIIHRIKARPRTFLDALADIQRRNACSLQNLRHFYGFIELASARHPFICRIPDNDREIVAAFALDRRNDFEHKAHPVLQAAAVPVCPPIEVGTHKLRNQVAVRRVQTDRIKARRLAAPCRVGKFPDEVDDVLRAHLADRFSLGFFVFIKDFMALRPRYAHYHIAGGINRITRHCALPAGMLKLYAGFRAITLDSLSQAVKTWDQLVAVGSRTINGGFPRFHFRCGCAHYNKPCAAFRELRMMVHIPFACFPV